ncbi:hypothetical protein IFM53868_11031 [Aspergillus udagawae]|uniref:DNA2/NAM7 helicase helicase domain-containing protein n=1 Tax=Aspergillus udagawae TaxID=91492 RepID=A0ABQ1BFI7_9EURO|nr:hypothetical protein IFM53868_11031 [Aspergillus udagawae]
MLLAPSNDVVNDLAIGIEEARLQFIPDREIIVVCCHVLGTEEDLLLMPAKKQRPRLANARPPIITEDDLTCPDGAAPGCEGLLGEAAPWLTLAEFISFCEHYRLYQAGEEFDNEMWKDFHAQSRELCDAVLAYVDAIICMLYAVGEQAIHDNVQPQAILVNEAACATEPELWPVLAFFNPNAFVLIGDHHQLCPLLHRNGLYAIILMEQHWMHESMAQMVSSVFYNGELRMSCATADQTYELAY